MANDLMRVRGIGKAAALKLIKAGITTIDQIAKAKPQELAFVKGIGLISAKKIIDNAKHLIMLEKGLSIVLDKVKETFSKTCPKCGGLMQTKYIILSPEKRLHAKQCSLCKFYMPL
ncbi:MAG: helix-hairpin-helix domain-containing protein [Promethearchaeota archaeon]